MKSRDDIKALMTRVFDKLQETRAAGQAESAHDNDNAFANFERTALEIDSTREKVLWTFAMKHKDGIAAWIKGHRSQREPVEGRIKDLIVYLILLWGMVEDDIELCNSPVVNANEFRVGGLYPTCVLHKGHSGRCRTANEL